MMRRQFWGQLLAFFLAARTSAGQALMKTSVYYDQRRREDFTATADNQSFTTAAGVRSSYVEVYWQGILQREGAPGFGDYTKTAVGASIKITFNPASNPVPANGQWVTLFYYPT